MPEGSLNQQKVVREALKLLQEEGLENVTFRKIAARLHIKGPSLYNHIEHKAYLLGLMTRSIMREILDSLEPVDTWQEWLYQFGLTMWESQLKLRDCAQLLNQAQWQEPWLKELTDELAAALKVFGVKRREALIMQSSVQSLVTGWATFVTGPHAQYMGTIGVSPNTTMHRSLRALIDGWAQSIDVSRKHRR